MQYMKLHSTRTDYLHMLNYKLCMRVRRLERILVQSLDLDNLSSKIARALKEGDTHAAFNTIRIVTRMDKFVGLSLAERTDFSKVRGKDDLENLLCLWNYPGVTGERLRQIILKSNPNLKEKLDELLREMEEEERERE